LDEAITYEFIGVASEMEIRAIFDHKVS